MVDSRKLLAFAKKLVPSLPVSIICTLWSVWGVVFLLLLCAFADTYPVKKGKIEFFEDHDISTLRIHLGIAAGMYFLFVVGCGVWATILVIKKVRRGTSVEYY